MNLRREIPPGRATADDPGDPGLLARIRAEIAATGPLTFARFMELALYDPDGGYYRSATARPGRAGDFLTAPEAHPIFGRALARFARSVDEALDEPDPFTIAEHGAGEGTLAVALLDGLALEAPEVAARTRYRPIEVEPRRIAAIEERLAAAGRAGRLETPEARSTPVGPVGPVTGLVLANEVLDALPTHRVVVRDGALREVFAGLRDDRLADVEGAPSTPALADRLAADGVTLAEGQRAEVCLALDDWVRAAATGLRRGVLLLIDYGHPAAQLYDPRRRAAGTLAAYRGHVVHDDPYVAVGRQDLTSHVDVTAVERAAASAGLDHLATVTQGPFLAGLGAGDLLTELQTGEGATLQGYLEARAALVRMIDPAAMGGFRVMAFGRGLPHGVTLRGLATPGDPAPDHPAATTPTTPRRD
jgi:SAM-dependent MidA family methyltransferase